MIFVSLPESWLGGRWIDNNLFVFILPSVIYWIVGDNSSTNLVIK